SFPRREPINTTRSTTATALPIRIFLVFDMSLSSSPDTADERIGFYETGRGKFRRVNPLRSGALGNKPPRLSLPDPGRALLPRTSPSFAKPTEGILLRSQRFGIRTCPHVARQRGSEGERRRMVRPGGL